MAQKSISERPRQTPVKLTCDVLVCGGGTAGPVAAIAAARNGADTVLVERYGSLGGAMINGATALHSFFNLYKAFPGAEKKQLVRGIPQEIVDRMAAAGGCPGHLEQEKGFDYDSIATVFDHEIFKKVIIDMLDEAGVRLVLHSLIVDTVKDGGRVQGVLVESKSGREAILAKQTIDCTGDADVAHHAGVPWKNCSTDRHGVGLTFGLANVDLNRAADWLETNGLLWQIVHGKKDNLDDAIVRIGFNGHGIPALEEYMKPRGMFGPLTVSLHRHELTYVNTLCAFPVDAIDTDQLTDAEKELRRQIDTVTRLFREHVPGFENAYVNHTSIQACVRRTRILECDYDLSLDEILDATRFDDEVALYGFHDCAPRMMIKDAGAYGVPYRALLPQRAEDLQVAGRMITSDYDAHMSTRNTVCCMALGQASGTAAALCSANNVSPRRLDVNLLRKKLVSDGAYLGG
ncbi:MAG: FAD-dependent oxidoreductase [Chitinivibrionales bacterium]|nr:FAD-dependent oxidoreductase [Chitinivibrionales bacterium]MBD3396175.1 FAD-dependent oxidoreductase [Chitinivibrionales bacterium]